jgi:hypothetical protein
MSWQSVKPIGYLKSKYFKEQFYLINLFILSCNWLPINGRLIQTSLLASNRPVGGEIVDVVDEAARGEQRDDLCRRLPGGLFV